MEVRADTTLPLPGPGLAGSPFEQRFRRAAPGRSTAREPLAPRRHQGAAPIDPSGVTPEPPHPSVAGREV
jgi:hypothetical protein